MIEQNIAMMGPRKTSLIIIWRAILGALLITPIVICLGLWGMLYFWDHVRYPQTENELVGAFAKAMQENDSQRAQTLTDPHQWLRIRQWTSSHTARPCKFTLDLNAGFSGAIGDSDSLSWSSGCDTSIFFVNNLRFLRFGNVWQIVDWGKMCDDDFCDPA